MQVLALFLCRQVTSLFLVFLSPWDPPRSVQFYAIWKSKADDKEACESERILMNILIENKNYSST